MKLSEWMGHGGPWLNWLAEMQVLGVSALRRPDGKKQQLSCLPRLCAIQHLRQSHQGFRCACGTMIGVIAHRVAILAKIRPIERKVNQPGWVHRRSSTFPAHVFLLFLWPGSFGLAVIWK
jgi:hypothetical protein